MNHAIKQRARKVLELNTNRSDGRVYFVADYKHYPLQYYWDSCVQAMVMSLFDGRRAEEEMYTLLSTQFPDGCMPYLCTWGRPPWLWRAMLRTTNWIGEDGRANLCTQPMLSAVATWEIYKRTGNRAFLEKVIPELAREADYMGVQRNLLDDGLVVIVSVMEAGTNESPVYDEIMGLPRPRGLGPIMHLLFYVKVARKMARFKRMGYDLEHIAQSEIFLVEDMTSNSLFCRSLVAMGDILDEIGEKRASSEYRNQAHLLAQRLEEKCWIDTDGFFHTRYGTRKIRKFSPVKTIAGLLPLFTGIISKEKAQVLVERHLANTNEFWTPWPVSYVAIDEPTYRRWVPPVPFPSLWRNCSWVCMNWMLFMGLRDYGYHDQAKRISQTCALMVERGGFREFFNSWNGRGYGGKNCGMTTLVADMLERTG